MDDMQCMWFQMELAQAYWRSGKYGDALQKLHEMDKNFSDMIDDQFDFHTYCMRKLALRSYISVLRLEDTLRKHPFYFRAAKLAVEIYVYLHDNPDAKNVTMNGPTSEISELSASERKKLRRKQKKAQLKAQEEKKENKPQKQEEEEKKGEQKYPLFDPKELLETQAPLDEALKFLVPLQMFSSGRIETHLLAYEVNSRRRKFLLMLQSIKRALRVDPENGVLHVKIVNFVTEVEKSRDQFAEPIRTVIDESLPTLTRGTTLTELNRDFLQKHKDSHEHLIYGAEAMYFIDKGNKDKAIGYATDLSDSISGKSIKTCTLVLKKLRDGVFGDCSDEVVTSYSRQCAKLFTMATAFKTDPTQPGLPDKSKVSKPDKVGRKVQPVSNVAMSFMSGDINDGLKGLSSKDCTEPTVDGPSQLADGPV